MPVRFGYPPLAWRWIWRSLADTSVTELLTSLEVQISDDASALLSGNITSTARELAYTMSVLSESASLESDKAISMSLSDYQPKGLFGFASAAWYTTEASGTVNLLVLRDHGSKGIMDIGFSILDGTTSGTDDYSIPVNVVRFYDGDTEKVIEILLVDNSRAEQHFKTFTVSLNLLGPINDGAALRASASTSTIFVYDYGDGIVSANTTFKESTVSSTLSTDVHGHPTSSGETMARILGRTREVDDPAAAGWTIVGNGGQGGWVDHNGFAAKDAIVGADEYGECIERFTPTCAPFK